MNPHVTDYTQQVSKHTVTVEPLGDKRKEIEAAAKRAFNGRTSDVRAALVAAGVAEPNSKHPHTSTYEDRADNLTVERSTFIAPDGLEYVKVTLEEVNA